MVIVRPRKFTTDNLKWHLVMLSLTNFSETLKHCSDVFDQFSKGVGGYANVIKILFTWVGFDD